MGAESEEGALDFTPPKRPKKKKVNERLLLKQLTRVTKNMSSSEAHGLLPLPGLTMPICECAPDLHGPHPSSPKSSAQAFLDADKPSEKEVVAATQPAEGPLLNDPGEYYDPLACV